MILDLIKVKVLKTNKLPFKLKKSYSKKDNQSKSTSSQVMDLNWESS